MADGNGLILLSSLTTALSSRIAVRWSVSDGVSPCPEAPPGCLKKIPAKRVSVESKRLMLRFARMYGKQGTYGAFLPYVQERGYFACVSELPVGLLKERRSGLGRG